jgi:hypothetical protein
MTFMFNSKKTNVKNRFSFLPQNLNFQLNNFSKSVVKPGDVITIQIKGFSSNELFAGFFMMARDELTNKSIGEFIIDDCEVCKAKAIDCHNNKKSAVTHKDNSKKESVILK